MADATLSCYASNLYIILFQILNIINLHLKSKLPSNIPGQKVNSFTWKTPAGWAEGSFISSMRRVGQA